MRIFNTKTLFAVVLAVLLCAEGTKAVDISGTITTTLTIFEDSRLVGDVTCMVVDTPCISFGAPAITLRLNGFTLTGRAEPPTNCATPAAFVPEDGIASVQQYHVSIIGPGVVQKFRRHGIFLNGDPALHTGNRVAVRRVTSNQNCFSGIQMSGVTDSDIVENISVRNTSASEQFACGGNCLFNSHNNRILRNVFSGNGSVTGSNGNNDFGVGLLGSSSGNLLEDNTIGGNTNGVLIFALAVGNIIRRNIIVGNPPIQVSVTNGATIGFDIRDLSPAGANTINDNVCLTYSGLSNPAPCPNIPNNHPPLSFTKMP